MVGRHEFGVGDGWNGYFVNNRGCYDCRGVSRVGYFGHRGIIGSFVDRIMMGVVCIGAGVRVGQWITQGGQSMAIASMAEASIAVA